MRCIALKTYLCITIFASVVGGLGCANHIKAHSPASETAPAASFSQFRYEGFDPAFTATLKKGQFQNPILAGFHPDPTITRAGGYYYLANSSFGFTPGLPIFKSQNLIQWQKIGYALAGKSILNLEGKDISRGIYAPTLRYHQGVFYLVTTAVASGGNFLITATDPAGPWSEPTWLPEVGGIDPDIFFDDNGKVYISHNDQPPGAPLYDGHRAIWMWQLDLTTKKIIAGSKKLLVNGGVNIDEKPVWVEGPHIFKRGDWYYLTCAEGGTGVNHSQVMFRTKNLDQPFLPYSKNPILTQRHLSQKRVNPVTSVGHADLFQIENGDWWAVFLGARPYSNNNYNTGRETFMLPVTWHNGWPHILPASDTVPYRLSAPKITAKTSQAINHSLRPTTGNFQYTDNFTGTQLDLDWVRLRDGRWNFATQAQGKLTLKAATKTLRDLSQPAFLARKIQHIQFTASIDLWAPANPNIEAGIAAFQNAEHHYFLGLKKATAGYTLFLEKVAKGRKRVVARENLRNLKANEKINLKIDCDGAKIKFLLQAPGDKKPVQLGDIEDGTLLSTEVAGGFVGAHIGPHVRATQPPLP